MYKKHVDFVNCFKKPFFSFKKCKSICQQPVQIISKHIHTCKYLVNYLINSDLHSPSKMLRMVSLLLNYDMCNINMVWIVIYVFYIFQGLMNSFNAYINILLNILNEADEEHYLRSIIPYTCLLQTYQ